MEKFYNVKESKKCTAFISKGIHYGYDFSISIDELKKILESDKESDKIGFDIYYTTDINGDITFDEILIKPFNVEF